MQDLYEVGFQSPYGELGNTTNQLRSVEDGNPAFQSPYGELGNTTRSQRYWDIVVPEEVSVPYGELGNTTWLRKTEKKIYAVSVPLRGIG